MKLITYNVNGIRAAETKGLSSWLIAQNPDVIGLQEIKAFENQFDWTPFLTAGYRVYAESALKPGYSGVAVLSRREPNAVVRGCGQDWIDSEGRIIRLDYDDFSFMTVYMPSGSSGDERQAYKMRFLEFFGPYAESLSAILPGLVIAGDYNICHQAMDIHDPVSNAQSSGFLPEERAWFGSFLERGFCDTYRTLHPESVGYSWWSYRQGARAKNKGWRIDYQCISLSLKDSLKEAVLHPDAVHSDHCPVSLVLFEGKGSS
ncbi:MAG: exodeoxyribonuclease III [Bacteroidia bacterium]|nr:exodeoxyribonuclease III [Bacteroidia bacterium]